jgi:hypothetical protein
MSFERTKWGILIGQTYLSAQKALDLLHWLTEQREWLERASQEQFRGYIEREAAQEPQQTSAWNQADEEEMRSEDEQIACFEL